MPNGAHCPTLQVVTGVVEDAIQRALDAVTGGMSLEASDTRIVWVAGTDTFKLTTRLNGAARGGRRTDRAERA